MVLVIDLLQLSAQNPTKPVNDFLKSLKGNINPSICWYTGTRLDSTQSLASGFLKAGNYEWSCKLVALPGKQPDFFDVTASFKLTKGSAPSAAVSVSFNFDHWDISNYVLVPAMIYGGNRFRILPLEYPPYIHDKQQRPLDMPVTTTNILHLNQDGSFAKVEMNTGNVSTPVFSFFNPAIKKGFILLFEQDTELGNNGMILEEDARSEAKVKRLSFAITAPGVREQRYVMCGRAQSGDKPHDWKAGDELSLKFKIYCFNSQDITDFYEKVFNERKSLTGQNSFNCVTPFSAAADLILEHHNNDKWYENEKTALYCNKPGNASPYHYQIGWSGIPLFSLPDLIAETPERLRRVCLSLDHVLSQSQGKTGLFHAVNKEGVFYGDPHGQMKERPSIAMTRRSMDVLYIGIQSLDLLKKRGHADRIKPEWDNALRLCADGLLNVWSRYGQFGQFIDVDNGEIEINGSTAGCAAGAGLALASCYFHESKYLEVAESATKMYYERDFLKGYAGGGAAEILQSPDSETPWDMAESCIALYSITGKPEWIERAKYVVYMLSTWMVSYDYKFPEGSQMGKAGIHAAGSIFASSQNNHSAPGYYILSGDFMLKLFRVTGEKRFAEMYKDQSHNVIQYVGAPYNPLRKEPGYVTERVQLSDWEGKNMGSVDNNDSNMAWEILAALTSLQNPGIYLHTDDDTFLVLDHVEAKVVRRDKSGVVIQITNPTKYDAKVTILAESKNQAKVPLELNAFALWPSVKINKDETLLFKISMDGKTIIPF